VGRASGRIRGLGLAQGYRAHPSTIPRGLSISSCPLEVSGDGSKVTLRGPASAHGQVLPNGEPANFSETPKYRSLRLAKNRTWQFPIFVFYHRALGIIFRELIEDMLLSDTKIGDQVEDRKPSAEAQAIKTADAQEAR
jgi:hypothetical protein